MRKRLFFTLFLAGTAAVMSCPRARAEDYNPPYPRIFMMIWGGASPAWYAEFDWVISTHWSRGELEAAREINPGLIASWTFDVNCCWDDYNGNTPCPEEWRMRGPDGSAFHIYGTECYLGDTTEYCEEYNGETYTEATIRAIAAEDYAFWSGWNSDGVWDSWVSSPMDANGDGTSDGSDYAVWNAGRVDFLSRLREAMPDDAVITLWGGKEFSGRGPEFLNGLGIEKFLAWGGWGWDEVNRLGELYCEGSPEPHLFYINAHYEMDPGPGGRSKNAFRNMRFGLATALMRDGYYDYEDGDGGPWDHNEHQWVRYYDEYDVPLGYPLAGAAEIRDHVYCRFFDGGAMVINANPNEEPVTEQDLEDAAVGQGLDWDAISGEEGHYYRFAGRQNPAFNDGSRFDEILLEGGTGAAGNTIGDGILLVRSPGRVVMAAVIIDTESCATSPSAQVASVEGFNGQCGDSGFRCGIGYCGETVPMWHYRSSGTGRGSRASFEVSMIHEGLYHVYEFHPAVEGWDVHHAVEHADGVETVLVDQRTNEEQWNLLGTFRFTPDKPARVTITDDASGTEVAADAIRFELAGCGDGLVGDGETCDGANLGGETCESRGYEAGTLRCLPDCGGFDESGCEGPAPDDGGEEAGPDAASDTGLEDGPADAVGPDGGGGFTSGGCGCGMAR